MITKITMNNVASYKSPAVLETDKPVNLIYGLNGAGKTTISKYLKDIADDRYNGCDIEPQAAKNYIFRVYNQSFVDEVFFNQDVQKGIFTLSKENKRAERQIEQAKNKQLSIRDKKAAIQDRLDQTLNDIDSLNNQTKNTCFKIKQDFTGGDRVLDQAGFLRGLKQKASLLKHLLSLDKNDTGKNVIDIEKEVELLNKTSSDGVDRLPYIEAVEAFNGTETQSIFKTVIVGKTDSLISGLIEYLGNSDWFSDGLKFLDQSDEQCPFCQQSIDAKLKKEMLDYVDDTYKRKIQQLIDSKNQYHKLITGVPSWEFYKDSEFIDNIDKLKNKYDQLLGVLKQNKKLIEEKTDKPSQTVELLNSEQLIHEFNSDIERINLKIDAHNLKVRNKRKTLLKLKAEFWQIQRNKFDDTISQYNEKLKDLNKYKAAFEQQISDKNKAYSEQSELIREQQKQTTNIDVTIEHINAMLLDCGIQSFKIIKHQEHFYRIAREDDESQEQVFTSLSEGEKTMISFFYFLALCKGNADLNETQDKIIVIDDPISSLSHMYVFNIAQLIKRELTKIKTVKGVNGEADTVQLANNKSCIQCFILTHSLPVVHFNLA